jgi:energy-coupling factor transport system permease protein
MLIVLLLLTAIIALVLLSGPAATAPLLIGPYLITNSGVWILMTFLVVLIVLYVYSLLLTMTTSPVALVEGLTILLSPLRRLKLPVDDFALMCLIALRFMPTLLEEVEQLIKAQTSRGADITRGTIRERLQSLMTLFVPLMQGALRHAAELATALEARGYEVEGKRTLLHETALGLVDYVVLGSIVFVTVSALLL